jgi:hypothetical protein
MLGFIKETTRYHIAMTASDEARFIRLGHAIMATSLLSSLS